MAEECSIQGGGEGNLSLFGAREGRIVDANAVEEPGRPGCRLDGFEDHCLPFAPDRDGVAFKVKSVGQLHRLRPVGVDDFDRLHGAFRSERGDWRERHYNMRRRPAYRTSPPGLYSSVVRG